jgi:regulatory protein
MSAMTIAAGRIMTKPGTVGDNLRKITALKVQKKRRSRISVFLDGRYALGLQATVAARLSVGQTLSADEIDELQQQDELEAAYDRTLNYLSYRPRSCAETQRYLQQRGVSPATAEAVIERLLRAGLLDDEAFAKYWVENREQFRPRGAYGLRSELRQKGVPKTAIESAIVGIDESASAYRAAQRRAQRLGHLDYATFRRRLGGFLSRRGFGYGTVKDTVNRLWQEHHGSADRDPA